MGLRFLDSDVDGVRQNSISAYSGIVIRHHIRRVSVDVFLLYCPPETLYPDVVLASSAAIHTYALFLPFQCVDPVSPDVYWLPWSVFTISGVPCLAMHSSMSSMQLDFVQRVAEPPSDDVTAVHVYHCIQIHVSMTHGDICDVRAPYLVGTVYLLSL